MSEAQLLNRLCEIYGSQNRAAKALGVNRGYFSRLNSDGHLSVPLLRRVAREIPELRDEAEALLLNPSRAERVA